MSNRFMTVHVLVTLGLHNLNRDGNGLPKSQVDGGVQRARLSSQSLKRAARRLYREAGYGTAVRTRFAAYEITRLVVELAERDGREIDLDAVIDTALIAVRSLYSGKEKTSAKALKEGREAIKKRLAVGKDAEGKTATGEGEAMAEAEASGAEDAKDTLVFLSASELDAFARAVYDAQTAEGTLPESLVMDARSDALDIAAFGRMFAEKQDLGTHAAVAVSHASTVHQMQLITDYFTAVEDLNLGTAAAGHIAETYFTSGTYYRSFTIDIDQLARSWSAFDGESARQQVAALVRALVLALPTGKVNATNAATLPQAVLAEVQNFRTAYGFETPITAGEVGGYSRKATAELARQRREALDFDPSIFGPAMILGGDPDEFAASAAANLDELVRFVVDAVYEGR